MRSLSDTLRRLPTVTARQLIIVTSIMVSILFGLKHRIYDLAIIPSMVSCLPHSNPLLALR